MRKKTLYIISSILTILSILGFIVAGVLIENNNSLWWTMLIPTLLFLVFFILTCIFYFPNAEFICQKCNKQFKPTVGASVLGPHTITRRYLKCPHCNKKSWAKETWDFENKKSD